MAHQAEFAICDQSIMMLVVRGGLRYRAAHPFTLIARGKATRLRRGTGLKARSMMLWMLAGTSLAQDAGYTAVRMRTKVGDTARRTCVVAGQGLFISCP